MTYVDSLLSEFVFVRFKSSSASFSLLQLVCASVNTEMALGCGSEQPYQDALEDALRTVPDELQTGAFMVRMWTKHQVIQITRLSEKRP